MYMGGKKEKLKYGFFGNLRFMFGNMMRWAPGLTALAMLRAPFIVAIPMIALYLSRTVIDLIETGAGIKTIALTILAIRAATAVCAALQHYLNGKNALMEMVNTMRYQLLINNCCMSHDYEYNESPRGLSDEKKAIENTESDQSGAGGQSMALADMG
jgi:hypothetical protein